MESSSSLLERARAGDTEALELLLEHHQAQIYRFSLKLCRDPEDARDVLQDTLLAMARSVRDFRGASSLSTWLYSITRSFCIKKRRRKEGAPAAEQSLEDEVQAEVALLRDPAMRPDDAFAAKEVELALERAIRSLEPSYREVLVLRDVEGLTAPEVAEVLAISVQAVKSRLHRARLSLRSNIAPLLGLGDPAPSAASSCPDVLTMFSRHLEDEISADVCTSMQRHLEGCPRCHSACDSLKRTLALCHASGPSVDVPQQVQASIKKALKQFLAEQK